MSIKFITKNKIKVFKKAMILVVLILGILAFCIWLPILGGEDYAQGFSRFQAIFFVVHDLLQHKIRIAVIAAGLFTFGADMLWSPMDFISELSEFDE